MIRIRKGSLWHWLYELNYELSDNPVPYQTDLCHFMRVVLLWLPMKLLLGLFVIVACVSMIFVLFFELIPQIMWLHWTVWGLITAAFVAWYLIENFGDAVDRKLDAASRNESLQLFGAWIAAKKRRICPFVEVE